MKTFYDDFVIGLKRSAEEQEKIEREIYELNVTIDQILKIDYKKLPADIQSDLALDLYSARCDTATDIVYIYAKSIPSGTLTLTLVEAKLVAVVS